MGFLADLDDRLLPGLARRLDHLVRKIPEPDGPAPLIVRLRRVDDRWTRRGPLALIRDVPQLGAVAVVALLVVNVGVVKARNRPERRPPAEQAADPDATPSPGEVLGGHLGPDLGENVRLYVAAARVRLRNLAATEPDGPVVAVVQFASYRTPEQVRTLLGPLPVARVMYRAPLKLPEGPTHLIGVSDVVRDTRKDFLRVAKHDESEAKGLLDFNKTVVGDPAQVEFNKKEAANQQREAAILRGPCACVYGVVVQAELRQLVDLLVQPSVRVVDPSPPRATVELFDYSALLPEETTTVTAGNQSG